MVRAERTGSLRYLPVDLLRAHALDFTCLDVRSMRDDREVLGAVEGFIVDTAGRRLHKVIVDCGAWFTGGSYLLPPEWTRVDPVGQVLWIDVTRESLQRCPRFDPLSLEELADHLVWVYEHGIIDAYLRSARRAEPAAVLVRRTTSDAR